jgi:diguanylate cyclase (GGDEF)-like protein
MCVTCARQELGKAMWVEVVALLLTLALGVCADGWLRSRRRLSAAHRDRTDLANSTLVMEIERRMLELVATGASLSEVLDTLTQAIERFSPESLCTVMLLDEEQRRTLLVASGPSLPQPYLQAINGLEIGPDAGACGSAASRNETIVVHDIATDYRFAEARDFVLSYGLRSCWSVPVCDSRNTVLGTFATYRRKVSTPRPEELRIARVAAQLAGNAIERIRAETQLSDTIKRLNLAETAARFGTWELDFRKGTMTLSQGLAALLERAGSTFKLNQAEFDAMVHPDDLASLRAKTDPSRATAEVAQDEFRLLLPSGAVRWMRSHWHFEMSEGLPQRATGAMIDITQEKDMVAQAERERAAAEESELIARQAERLEQDRKIILELVANDRPLQHIVAAMADAVTSHLLPGSLCAIRIEPPDAEPITLYPDFPEDLAGAINRVAMASINATTSAQPIRKLSDDGEWALFLAASGRLSHHYYRAVPVLRDSIMVGMIVSLIAEDRVNSQVEQTLLESWARFASLAVERRGLYEQLSFRAQYDSLTNLSNRASLYDRLDNWIRAHAVERGSFALIYLDLDAFKQINDSHGHGAGDRLLQHVAAHIQKSVRRSDVAARIGGDEFVIALPGIDDRDAAAEIAQLVAAAIALPFSIDGRNLHIGLSFGISIFPNDGDTTDALLKVADENMYRMKQGHRDQRALSSRAAPSDADDAVQLVGKYR